MSLVRFKSDPLAAFVFRAQRGSDSKDAWNRGVNAQQKCCAPKLLNCWMTITNLPTCYTSIEGWGLPELNGVHIISAGAPDVYPDEFNPPTSQLVFTSPYIRVHRFAIQSLIGNSGHTCTLSGLTCDCSADAFKSGNRGLNARKRRRTLHKN